MRFPVILLGLLAVLPAADPPCLGAWQNIALPGDQMAFQTDRLVSPDGCIPARYPDPGTVRLGWRGEQRLGLTVSGDTLVAQQIGKPPATFRRLSVLPKELQVSPMAFPSPAPIPADQLRILKRECADRLVKDQAIRTGKKVAGADRVDADNTAWLKAQIARFGWLDAGRCGSEVASDAFLFVQHSGDMPLMLAALPCIEADLKAGTGDPQDFALLYDRVQINSAHRQRYGTQIGKTDGGPAVYPLEDRARVDSLRAQIRLGSLSSYLAMINRAYGLRGKAIAFMDDLPPAP